MATPAETAAYRRHQQNLVTLAQADLARFWRTLDHTDPLAVKAALEAFYPDLVAAYGSAAAAIAADHYDELRGASGARGVYRATVAPAVPADHAKAVARWGIGPLFSHTPEASTALSLLAGATQRLVRQPGRDTISRNVRADRSRPRYARVPGGPKPCAFCLMLASRGAVYVSEESATFAGHSFDKYHNDCDCEPEPVWDSQRPSYDVDALYDQYNAARHAAGGGDPQAILAHLRDMYGLN